MTKTEQKEKAKDILQSVIGCAYYRLENENFSEEDEEAVMKYINKYGVAACKAFRREYITF